MKNFLFIFVFITLLSGCAAPYATMGTKGYSGGYDDKILAPGHFAIKIRGNAYNSKEKNEEYFHKRASELSGGQEYEFKMTHTTTKESQFYQSGAMGGVTFHEFPILYGEILIVDEAQGESLSDDIYYLEEWAVQKR